MSQFQHLTLSQGAHEIVLLRIDVKDSPTNILSLAVLKEINEAVGGIRDQGFKGLVISSAKPNHFIQGADTATLLSLKTPQAVDAYINLGSQVCRRIAELPFPTVALIEGSCLNSGWDIALSCQRRVASYEATVNYDYFQQGYYSGFGGITRLITRIGLRDTLRFLSKGEQTAEQLKALSLVDHRTPSYQTQAVIDQFFQHLRESENTTPYVAKTHRSNSLIPRHLLLLALKKQDACLAKSPSEQQACASIIDTWSEYNISEDAYLAETKSAIKLLQSPLTQYHLKLTQLKQRLNAGTKRLDGGINRVHIIGCGSMGRYIARLCAQNGFIVTLYDTRNSALEKLLPELNQYFTQQNIAQTERQRITDNINLSPENYSLPHADIVIEATPEVCLAKASLLKDIESSAKDTALLLTSTSCFPLEELSKNMQTPSRLALFNPYNPCFKSDLVEVSTTGGNQHLATIQSFAKSLSLTPAKVKSATGYLGTRLMMVFLTESMLIHQARNSIISIDKQALKMGMCHAPFELIDEIGITECLRIAEALADRRGIDVPNILIQKHEQGLVGKRSGSGFYRYKNGVKQDGLLNNKLTTSTNKIKVSVTEQRLIEKIINEARACLKEGIVEDEDILDLVATMTTGFPMQHGGPLNYLKALKAANKTLTK
ncbi:3-hydroxyacyl-CoA dehydrogenase NAD-binding domain-containing protein [Leucothrix arctica]|uniref:Uncharacterized protein n=1 Tax=Leucothrix arctica TaxID=1481894 RepID=A0A317CA96_9GAMM|nr:3-hydroxyacyl-CoA dehydrogenase NAD-binding domain-containing protein [Leucothrix arctica]PWQ95534.1 hypothetical protein DKT75_12180 [Leucothrix arctica]